jgi:hypothetical protein
VPIFVDLVQYRPRREPRGEDDEAQPDQEDDDPTDEKRKMSGENPTSNGPAPCTPETIACEG